MKNKFETQRDTIVSFLKLNGKVSRNFCLKNYISRLGAHIYQLKKEGYKFETYYKVTENKFGKSKDYVYKVIKAPVRKVSR